MMSGSFKISAFGDEIADDLDTQLSTLSKLKIRFLELRGVWGKNVLDLSDDQVGSLSAACADANIQISAIGSPIGKSPLEEPDSIDGELLSRAIDIANRLSVTMIRVFSFYPPQHSVSMTEDELVENASARLRSMATRAASAGNILLLENEKGIVGDRIERCLRLLKNVDSASLRFAWDPANFVQVGEMHPTTDGWPVLGSYVSHVHIKDALADGEVQPAGGGAGQVGELLVHLRDINYQGFLALEPHLVLAGHSSGFSGPDGMERAAKALRSLLSDCGFTEG